MPTTDASITPNGNRKKMSLSEILKIGSRNPSQHHSIITDGFPANTKTKAVVYSGADVACPFPGAGLGSLIISGIFEKMVGGTRKIPIEMNRNFDELARYTSISTLVQYLDERQDPAKNRGAITLLASTQIPGNVSNIALAKSGGNLFVSWAVGGAMIPVCFALGKIAGKHIGEMIDNPKSLANYARNLILKENYGEEDYYQAVQVIKNIIRQQNLKDLKKIKNELTLLDTDASEDINRKTKNNVIANPLLKDAATLSDKEFAKFIKALTYEEDKKLSTLQKLKKDTFSYISKNIYRMGAPDSSIKDIWEDNKKTKKGFLIANINILHHSANLDCDLTEELKKIYNKHYNKTEEHQPSLTELLIFISKLDREGYYDESLREQTKTIRTKVVDKLLISTLSDDGYDKILKTIIQEADSNEYTLSERMFSEKDTINTGVLFGTGYRKIAEKIKELMGEKEEYKDFKLKYKDFSNEMFVLNFFEQSSLTKKHEIKFVRPELDLTYYFHEFSDSKLKKDNQLEAFKSRFQKFLQEKQESSASAPDSEKLQTILDNYNDLIEKFLDETTTSQDYFATGSNYFNTETEKGRKTVLQLNKLQELKEGKKSSPFEAAIINTSYPYYGNFCEELNRQEPDIMSKITHFVAPFVNGIKSPFVECSENVQNFIWDRTPTHFHEAVDTIPSLQRDAGSLLHRTAEVIKLGLAPDRHAPDCTPIEDHSSLSHIAPTEHHASLQDLLGSVVDKESIHGSNDTVFCHTVNELAGFMGPVVFGAKFGADITDAIIEQRNNGLEEKYTNAEKFTGKMAGGVAGAVVGGGGLAAVTHLAPAAAAFVAPLTAPLAAAGVVGYNLGQLVYDLSDRTQENDNNENAKLERLCFGLLGAGTSIGLTASVFAGAFLVGGVATVGGAIAVATPVIASIGLGVGAARVGMLAYDNSPYSYEDVKTGIEDMYQLGFAGNLEKLGNNCSLIASKIADSCSQAASKISDTLNEKINGPDYKDQISREAIDLFNLAYPQYMTSMKNTDQKNKFQKALDDILAGKTQSDVINYFTKDTEATRGNVIIKMILGEESEINGKKPQEILQEIIIKNTYFDTNFADMPHKTIKDFFKDCLVSLENSDDTGLKNKIEELKKKYHTRDFAKEVTEFIEDKNTSSQIKNLAEKYKIKDAAIKLQKVIDKIEKFKENAEQNLRSKTIDGAIQHAIKNNDIPNLSKLLSHVDADHLPELLANVDKDRLQEVLASFSPESANELYRRIMFSAIGNKLEILDKLASLHSGIQPNSCLFLSQANALQDQKQVSAATA